MRKIKPFSGLKYRRLWIDPSLCLLILAFTAGTAGNHLSVLAGWLSPLATVLFLHRQRPVSGLSAGFCTYILAHIIGWRGVLPFAPLTAAGVAALMGAIAFLPFAVDRLLSPRLPPFLTTLVLPAAWVVTALAAHSAGVGTWGDIGYTQFPNGWFLQSLALSGLSGMIFCLGWAASAMARFILSNGRSWRPPLACLIAGLCLFGFAIYHGRESATAHVRIAGITVDNMEVFKGTWRPLSHGRPLEAAAAAIVRPQTLTLQEKLLSASRAQARSGAKIIVWSEGNALVFKADEAAFVARGQALARAEGVYLFMAMAVMTPGGRLAANKLTVITPSGAVAGTYLKSHPAPGEASIAGRNGMGVMDTPYGRLAWAICYDFDFPAFIRQAGQKGADILIDPSWEGANMAPLHSRMAAFRAVENGAALIRVVNGGISLAVDRNGRIRLQMDQTHAATPETVMLADLPVRGKPTLYGRFGDWVGKVSAFLLAGLLWLGFRRRI